MTLYQTRSLFGRLSSFRVGQRSGWRVRGVADEKTYCYRLETSDETLVLAEGEEVGR